MVFPMPASSKTSNMVNTMGIRGKTILPLQRKRSLPHYSILRSLSRILVCSGPVGRVDGVLGELADWLLPAVVQAQELLDEVGIAEELRMVEEAAPDRLAGGLLPAVVQAQEPPEEVAIAEELGMTGVVEGEEVVDGEVVIVAEEVAIAGVEGRSLHQRRSLHPHQPLAQLPLLRLLRIPLPHIPWLPLPRIPRLPLFLHPPRSQRKIPLADVFGA